MTLAFSAYADKYKNYAELAAQNTEGVDYRIEVLDLNSPITLMAPHGGPIEPGSSELLREVSRGLNQYHFIGMKADNNFDLHLTSANFDEPRAVNLAQKSKTCVSFHGYIGKGENAICIGGANKKLAQEIKTALDKSNPDFEVLYPCLKYPGAHPKNIVNLCEEQGVQLEMSTTFRDRIQQDEVFKKKIADIIRETIVH